MSLALAATLFACADTGPGSGAGPPSATGSSISPSPASPTSVTPTPSIGIHTAQMPLDPDVALPSYGFYALQDPRAPEKPEVTLTDQRGRPFDFVEQTKDPAVTLLYFGYTNCPDLCPSELGMIASTLRTIPSWVSDRVQMVFVTVDPARDTAPRLKEYMDLFDPRFVALTGSEATIRGMQEALGIPPATREPLEGGGYAMRHAAEVLAFSHDGRVHLRFPFGMTLFQWQHDLWKLVEKGWRSP